MNIIALNGRKGSGKNTAADLIEEILSPTVCRQVAFADSMKVLLGHSLGFRGTDAEIIGAVDNIKNGGKLIWQHREYDEFAVAPFPQRRYYSGEVSGRSLLQLFGMKGRDLLGNAVWTDTVLPRPSRNIALGDSINRDALETMYPGVETLIITDLRLVDEALRVHRLGGEVWEIRRLGFEVDDHISEQPLPRNLVTLSIVNDSTTFALKETLRVALDAVRTREGLV